MRNDMNIKEILEQDSIPAKIAALKEKSVSVPDWEVLRKIYEPKGHSILEDKVNRVDKVRSDGTIERASRISVGLEKLLAKRVNEFTFAIPVRRVYSNIDDNETRKNIAKALELIYKYARINTENTQRGLSYYASCEILTVWYTVEKAHSLYGFPANKKLKCKTFSPMSGEKLYPLFDDFGDLIAVSFEYVRRVKDKDVTFFETYTAEKHCKWKNDTDNGGWVECTKPGGEDIEIMKIPAIYAYRKEPIYHDLPVLRKEIEYALSRNSDILSYNSAPVLMVAGNIQGEEKKDESRRVVKVTNGGKVEYVSWNQSTEAFTYHIDTMLKLFFMQGQMPDISFENMKSLGNIGFDARMTLLMDAHLKIGDESGPWMEFLDREVNVVKAFLKKLQVSWEKEVDNVDVENIITPFVQNDRKGLIDTLTKANGGKAVMSQLETIRELGESDDPEATLKQIQEEDATSSSRTMESMFTAGAI